MRVGATGLKTVLFGSIVAFSSPLASHAAHASAKAHTRAPTHAVVTHSLHGKLAPTHIAGHLRAAGHRQIARGGISCVPFARKDSGIELAGNAWQWWDHASGVYSRGSVPEPGSVLAFRANPHMRLGHVAVVSRVVNRREVEIDHANWWGPAARGGVARNIPVVDVSEANDWSAVRVGLGRSDQFGSVYPTYGFIYDKPDTGVIVTANAAPSPQPSLNPAPRDLRPVAERPWRTFEEVAEAPAQPTPHLGIDLTVHAGLPVGAIDRK